MELTQAQQQAVDHFNGPAITIAGPGAGKTRIIIERVRKLITENNVSPQNILVTTFTEKAANELKIRLSQTIGKKAESTHISTIHSFCKSMLESYFQYHSYGAEINVMDDESQSIFLEVNKQKLGFARWSNSRRKVVYVKSGIRDQDFVKEIKSLYDRLTSNRINTEQLINNLRDMEVLIPEDEKIINSYDNYVNLLASQKKVDFSMIQSMFYELLINNQSIAQELNEKFQYILVDEYQDTSPIQDKIFEIISRTHQNIFVVGDVKQSIYGFRGADVHNFHRFKKKYPNTKEFLLNTNFRSTKTIVDATNEIFESDLKEKLNAFRESGNKMKLVYDAFSDDTARETINLIKQLKESNVIKSYGDVVLLFRSLKSHSEEFIKYLNHESIPYVTFGDGKYIEREEIQTMLFVLSYITQELYLDKKLRNWSNWWRRDMFLGDFFDFSSQTKDLIQNGDFKLFALNTIDDFKAIGFQNDNDINVLLKLNHLKAEVEKEQDEFSDMEKGFYSILTIFYKILQYSGYLKRLLDDKTDESKEKLHNLGKLSQIIRQYIEIRGKEDVKGFLWYIYSNSDHFDQAKVEKNDTVKLMTVHKAKGLEFPVVILCCLNEGRFPLRYRSNDFVPIPDELLMREDVDDREAAFIEEEKRLFYVGVSRAQDILVFTGSEKHKSKSWRKSRFLNLISDDMFTDDIVGECEREYKVTKKASTLNYSAVNMFIDCPLRYDLTYNYGFETPASFMQSVGVFIHNSLQAIHERMKNQEKLTNEDLTEIINSYWIDLPITKKKNIDLRNNYLKKFIAYYQEASTNYKEIIAIEESFSHIDDSLIIKGKVDLIAKDINNDTILFDFKARSKEGLLETNVAKQLQVYDYCLDEKHKIDKLVAYTFLDGQVTEFDKRKEETIEFLQDTSSKIDKEDFPKQENQFCGQCHFEYYCWKT